MQIIEAKLVSNVYKWMKQWGNFVPEHILKTFAKVKRPAVQVCAYMYQHSAFAQVWLQRVPDRLFSTFFALCLALILLCSYHDITLPNSRLYISPDHALVCFEPTLTVPGLWLLPLSAVTDPIPHHCRCVVLLVS